MSLLKDSGIENINSCHILNYLFYGQTDVWVVESSMKVIMLSSLLLSQIRH